MEINKYMENLKETRYAHYSQSRQLVREKAEYVEHS